MFICRSIKKNLSAFLDDELPEKRRRQTTKHIRNCPDCENELEIMRRNNLSLAQYFGMRKSHSPEPEEKGINSFLQNIKNNASSAGDTEHHGSRVTKDVIRSLKQKLYMYETRLNLHVSSSGVFVIQGYFHIIPALLAAAGIILLFASELHGF